MLRISNWFFSKHKLVYTTLTTTIGKCNFSINPEINSKKLEYLLILDLEATCDSKKKMIQEIIEFPCLKINLSNLKEEGRFHRYVRPVVNPTLTDFCIELTGILQEMIDDEKTFPEVYELFEAWRLSEGLTENNSIYVTSGDWDLGHMMPTQFSMSEMALPNHMHEWIDIKKIFASLNGKYFDTFIRILNFYNLNFQGRPHSGLDDCLNIYNVVQKFAMQGAEFNPTSRLTIQNSKRRVLNLLRPYGQNYKNAL